MSKLKLIVAAVLTAVALGTAAVAAPSASAQKDNCRMIRQKMQIYYNVWQALETTGYGWSRAADVAFAKYSAYLDAWAIC